MPVNSQFKTTGEMIRFALRCFGWMLGLMGAFSLLISLFPLATGREISFAGLVAGVGILCAGVAILRVSRRFATFLENRVPILRLNSESAWNDAVDENRKLDSGPYPSPRSSVGPKAANRKLMDGSHLAQKVCRMGDRNRLMVGRKRSMKKAYYTIGVVFLIIAFFYGNGHNVVSAAGSWEIDFIFLIMVLLGMTTVIIAGLNRYVEIDRVEGWVKHGWKWLSFRFAKRLPLRRFDHVLIRRLTHYESSDASIWQPVDAHLEVLLRGAESLNLSYFDNPTDARELALKVADYTGIELKDESR